jgi:hypothetical protein
MHAITGITGNVGGEVARALLNAGHAVRAVIRDPRKGAVWEALGCDVSLADMNDAAALAAAFKAASDVFVLLPPNFDPSPDFPENASNSCRAAAGVGNGSPGKSRLYFHNWRTGEAGESVNATHHHGGIARRFAHADHVPASGVVYGQLQLGRGSGA